MKVLSLGVFDLLHVGHLRYLRYCRSRGDHLTVAVCPDELCRDLKGRAPVIGLDERCEMLRGLACVDEVCVLPCRIAQTERAADWIASLGVGLIVPGSEWAGADRWIRLAAAPQMREIEISFASATPGISTSIIRGRVEQLARPPRP